VLPRALWHRARHLPGKGFGVTTYPESLSAPPARKGLWCHHVPRGTERATRQERALVSPRASRHQDHHHMSCGSRPTSWYGRALELPCPVALGPQACSCVPKMPDIRLIMASPGTRCR
jgi:hypothetical protein